ncbi:flavin-containing monooxygenase [Angustibacter sp. McL0619]|uniref:flavin-containing monooxygenase n=1 Tax=Angustibacter sp. McL0619 TaxID=3415676 RepID=UPI003CEB315A
MGGVHDAVVIGSGFGGLAAAIELRRAGVQDVVLLEKADDLGGTWRDNRYPGCACDVPSHLYSFSFAPSAQWSRAFAQQPEIWDYLRRVAADFGVAERIRYGEELVEATYEAGTWRLRTARGTTLETRSLVLATGALSEPAIPDLPGLDSFRGQVFHTASWPQDDTAAIDGLRVAVVGTGASAVQAVPQLAPRASHLTVLQRTPSWILPKGDREIGRRERDWLERLPALNWLVRAGVYWRNESRVLAFTSKPGVMKLLERIGLYHLRKQVQDPAVRAALTPAYRMGCKRILISNDYLPTFNRPDVTLVTDAIERIEPDAVVTADGRRHEVDTLVMSTGFAVTEPYQHLTVTGPGGRTLREAWSQGMQAHLGVTVAGFPNLFLVVGPNSGLGHNSMIFMIEAQTRYLAQCIVLRDNAGARSIGVPQQVQDRFNAELAERNKHTVWATGCHSWYLDRFGNNRTLWPASTINFWRRTRRVDPRHVVLDPDLGSAEPAAPQEVSA